MPMTLQLSIYIWGCVLSQHHYLGGSALLFHVYFWDLLFSYYVLIVQDRSIHSRYSVSRFLTDEPFYAHYHIELRDSYLALLIIACCDSLWRLSSVLVSLIFLSLGAIS